MIPSLPVATLLACLALVASARAEEPAAPAEQPAPAEASVAAPADPAALEAARIEKYDRFKALVAESRYADAVPLAREVVSLTAALDADHEDLSTAWNNLGVAQLRADDPGGALESFRKALDLVESTQGIGSRRLIAPMAGLGAAYSALGEPAQAAAEFERAVAVSRRTSGLFNMEQLDLMDALIRAYAATGFDEGVDRERGYALRVVEKRFGYGDPRTLPRVTALAEWYEATGRYAAARLLYKRALDIASRESGGRNASTIDALLAVARTHRLQFAEDPESLIEQQDTMPQYAESIGGSAVSRVRTTASTAAIQPQSRVKIDPEARTALDQALNLLESSTDPPPTLMSRALLESGDWSMTVGATDQAIGYYQRAWPLLASSAGDDGAHPLAAPKRLLYRAPGGQKRSRQITGADTVELRGEFRIDVAASGAPALVEYAGGTFSSMQSSQVERALRRAVFRPAFVDGQPVATTGFMLTEEWIEYRSDYESRSGGQAPDDSPAPEEEGVGTADGSSEAGVSPSAEGGSSPPPAAGAAGDAPGGEAADAGPLEAPAGEPEESPAPDPAPRS